MRAEMQPGKAPRKLYLPAQNAGTLRKLYRKAVPCFCTSMNYLRKVDTHAVASREAEVFPYKNLVVPSWAVWVRTDPLSSCTTAGNCLGDSSGRL